MAWTDRLGDDLTAQRNTIRTCLKGVMGRTYS
jgi:hypothetical protein